MSEEAKKATAKEIPKISRKKKTIKIKEEINRDPKDNAQDQLIKELFL